MQKAAHFLFYILVSLPAGSQKQNNTWYFGDHAGITFNSTPVSALTDGVFIQAEGVASISDESGRLLFFTDGVTVWDKNRQRMPNGTGLLGDNSSSQSALIVPKPFDCNTYYIFTAPVIDLVHPMSYSVVDMTLHGGLGDIAIKNIRLHYPMTERLHATIQKNRHGYWVVGQEYGSNRFVAYSVTSSGVDTNPVISPAGLPSTTQLDGFGYMKISHDGSKLSYTSLYGHGYTELFDFNNETGVVSNPITLSRMFAYGVEFSPDNSKLYTSTANAPFILSQYDLKAGSAAAIRNSKVDIFTTSLLSPQYGGALQAGPDNKIYVNRLTRNFLGTIHQPNLQGTACHYVDSSLSLGVNLCQDGLPNAITTYIPCSPPVNGAEHCALDPSARVYLSPFSDHIIIDKPPANCRIKLKLFNAIGQLLLQEKELHDGVNTIQLGHLPAAVYFYCLYSDRQILLSGKLVHQ